MLASYSPQTPYYPFVQDFSYMGFDPSQNMMPQYSQYAQYYQYQSQYYDPFMNQPAPFSQEFPRAKSYAELPLIIDAFPHLKDLNNPEFDVESISPNAQFYIMRSSNDDNVHKAVKYHKWSTTAHVKNVLKKSWKKFEEDGAEPEIYLIFTVFYSNQLLGVAKMISNVNDEDSFKYWWEPFKWFGSFQLQWLFLKDIDNMYFEHIREEQSKSIVNIKDGTKIGADSGKDILTVFKSFPSQVNIFDSFDYMDQREDYIRNQRDSDPEFNQNFEKFCTAFLNGEDVNQFNKQYLAKQTGRKYSAQTANNFANKHHQQRPGQSWTNENGRMPRKYSHPVHKSNNYNNGNGFYQQNNMRPHHNTRRKNHYNKAKEEELDVEKRTNDHSDSSKSNQGSGEKRNARDVQLTEV